MPYLTDEIPNIRRQLMRIGRELSCKDISWQIFPDERRMRYRDGSFYRPIRIRMTASRRMSKPQTKKEFQKVIVAVLKNIHDAYRENTNFNGSHRIVWENPCGPKQKIKFSGLTLIR